MADIETIADIMTPRGFHYYAPAIMTESLTDENYLDWGVRAIIPHNKNRKPRGDWWFEFFSYFNERQSEAVREYLRCVIYVASEYNEARYLAEDALSKVWFRGEIGKTEPDHRKRAMS